MTDQFARQEVQSIRTLLREAYTPLWKTAALEAKLAVLETKLDIIIKHLEIDIMYEPAQWKAKAK
jgi:hypothetical protein